MTTYQKISVVIVDEIWTVSYNFVPIKFEICVRDGLTGTSQVDMAGNC